LVEREQGYDREARYASYRFDRGFELAEVEERLEHEQVDPAPVEQPGLFGEDRPAFLRRDVSELSERPDRPGDENVLACHFAGLARELHSGLVDPGDVVLEVVGAQL